MNPSVDVENGALYNTFTWEALRAGILVLCRKRISVFFETVGVRNIIFVEGKGIV